MQVTCLGAARTVTGSAYLIEVNPEVKFLVDCGMYQGGRQIERRNWVVDEYLPQEIKGIFITHAHIDHSGLVPRLVRMGYQGPVYASKATSELLKILWLDSAHIQEMEARWQTRKNARMGKEEISPLYETADAEAAIGLLAPLEMGEHESIIPGVNVNFICAGHILGASSLMLELNSGQEKHRLGFSGDLGRPGQLIVPDPKSLSLPDTLFMETTYGNRTHKTLTDSQAELVEVINEAYKEGGKVVIPAFAVERTQELIYTMADAHRKGQIPDDMPVFLDSPLAIKATHIFRDHPEFFDQETRAILEQGNTPLNFPSLKFTLSTEESMAINERKGPAVIMAGNGMASAGRIKHHLKHNLWRSNCHVVIVGFQAQGTTGRRLVEGASTVKIFREPVSVRAKVHTIGGFSAHADKNELLEWLGKVARPGLKVNLTHGEEASALAFMAEAKNRFPGVMFKVPKWKETIRLGRRPAVRPAARAALPPEERQRADRAKTLARRLSVLAAQVKRGQTTLGESDLALLESKLEAMEQMAGQGDGA